MLSNLKIGKKLLVGFGMLTVLLVLIGLTGIYYLQQADKFATELNVQNEIETDAQIINGLIYRARYNTMRGIYAKDIKEKTSENNSYRNYLEDEMDEIGDEITTVLDRIIKCYNQDNPQDAADINRCKEIRDKLFADYNTRTTDWANEQDDVLLSAGKRLELADKMQSLVKGIIETTNKNIVKERQVISMDGVDTNFTNERLAKRQEQLGEMLELIEKCRRQTREQITITEMNRLRVANDAVRKTLNQIKETLNLLINDFATESNAQASRETLNHLEVWRQEVENYITHVEKQHALFAEFAGIAGKIVDSMNTILENARKTAVAAQEDMNDMLRTARTIIIFVIVVAIILASVAGYVVTSNITTGLGAAAMAMNIVAKEGDLSLKIPQANLERKDEVGDMAKSFAAILEQFRHVEGLATHLASGNWRENVKIRSEKDVMNQNLASMLDQVNGALREINESVKQVSTGAGEVSSASQTLSSGAQESAASLEEITASMNEISGQTKQNAQSATEARDLAQQASAAAAKGQEAMKNMTGAMDRITQNSGEIQRVIKVIDDIAFQTNLLALNAAVEAARAGVHGKGFAVVAEEVRNLAARSAKAAQETTELISKSGEEIQAGGEVANRTAEVLDSIVDQIKKTTDLVAGIAIASNEQAQGVAQVTVGLQQIDAVTQQNTAAAEESASAANEMSSMASNLQNLVAKFQLR